MSSGGPLGTGEEVSNSRPVQSTKKVHSYGPVETGEEASCGGLLGTGEEVSSGGPVQSTKEVSSGGPLETGEMSSAGPVQSVLSAEIEAKKVFL